MKLTIDEKVCLKHKMTLQECFFALAVRSSQNPQGEMLNMENREILIKDRGVYKMTQHWSDVLDKILRDSMKHCDRSDEQLLELAKKLREVYPKEKMKDRRGNLTPYYYSCNNSEVAKALKRFFALENGYSDEDILDATRRYVASFQGQYWQKGLRLLKYFIIKNEKKEGEGGNYISQISDLLTYLENKKEGENENEEEDKEWTSIMV